MTELSDDKLQKFSESATILWNKWCNLEKNLKMNIDHTCQDFKSLIQNPIVFENKKNTISSMQRYIDNIPILEDNIKNNIKKFKKLAKETIQLATILLPKD